MSPSNESTGRMYFAHRAGSFRYRSIAEYADQM
jgi:hypothetical protein